MRQGFLIITHLQDNQGPYKVEHVECCFPSEDPLIEYSDLKSIYFAER